MKIVRMLTRLQKETQTRILQHRQRCSKSSNSTFQTAVKQAGQVSEPPATIDTTNSPTAMPTTTPASPQPTLHIADAELDVSTQVDRLTQLQARLGPNRQQVDEDKLVIILRRYQWDVGQALSFFRLWCLLGSPPIDYDETQGYVEPWDDNARTDTEPFTQDEDPSDDQTGDRRNIEEGMPDLQVADPNTSATYPAQPHHSRGESVTLSESEQIFEADTQEVIDRSMAEYEENMQKIVHGTQEMSVTEPDEPEGGLSPNLRAAVRDARLKKQAGTNDNDTPESSKEQERRRKAQEEKRRKLKALGELFGGNTTDARSTKPKPLEQGGGSAKQLSKTTENRPPAEEIVPRSPQAGLPPRPIGTMGDDQGQRPSNHGSDAVSSSAVEGPDQVPSTTSSTQSPPTVSNDRSRPTRNDKPDVSKCDKTPKVSNNKSDYSPTRPRPKSTPYTQEELDVPAVALILQNTPQRPLPFSESVEVARLIREAREAAQTTAIATTAVTNEPPSSHNDADSNNSQAEHDVIPSSEGPDGDGDKQRDNSDSAQSAADEIDESKGGERSDDREAAPNSGQDGSGGDGDGDRDTDDDQPRDQDNASKSSTSSDDSSDNEEGQDADSHNGPGTESVSQNIEGGSNPNETQGAPEQSEKSRGAPEPPTTTPANPQSQLSPAEQQTQLAEFARRVSPATLTQNELRFLLQFRRWNMDAAVEMVPSFLSRKRERERREREEAERRRQIAIEAAKTSAEDADGVENADQNDEENREDENDRSWEDYIRRHEGEAALSGGTRSVEESNQHHDQSQENDHAIAVAIDAEQAESDGQVESQDDRDFVDAGPRIGQEAALTPSQSELIDDMILRMHLEESAGAYTNQETAMADSPNDGDEGREKGEDCEGKIHRYICSECSS